MQLLVQEPYLTIGYDQVNNWIYTNWTGDQTKETVQAGCTKMLEQLKLLPVHKILNDNREVTNAWSDAASWVGSVWFPDMVQAGLRAFAWVYSPHAFSRLSADISIGYTKTALAIAAFDSLSEAEEWLSQQP